jgi:succinate dehydrogenase / fumarate reductase cytochrome b subunit
MTSGKVLQSTVAHKFIMAISGLLMVGFLVAHLSGNLLIYGGPQLINKYAEKLRDLGPLLWVMRLGLLAAVILHIRSACILTLNNRAAHQEKYVKKTHVKSNLASRTMMLTGFVVLSFVLYHLAHFTFRWTHREAFASLGEYQVYEMMLLSFKSPFVSGFYSLSVVLLMLHLYHGVVSFFQTLGVNSPQVNVAIKTVGPAVSIALGIGFLSIPVSIFLGWLS